ncbi:MAG: trypsin-like peptidase domain-containing protein [Albidovulum sp.]
MRFVLLFLTLFPCIAAADAPLKRLTLRHDVLGFEAVGKVEIEGAGYCTGTLISPREVLTAAHCLYPDGVPADPAKLRFRAGLRDGASIGESVVARAVAHPRYHPDLTGMDRIRYDVAILELSVPIPAATAAPFQVATLPAGQRDISVVSFARGRDAALSWQRGCSVLGRQAGLLAFDCDVTFGASGAPVFDQTSGRARIVSIISSGQNGGTGSVAFGMDLPRAVADLHEALRIGQGVLGQASAPGARRIGAGSSTAGTGARFVRP